MAGRSIRILLNGEPCEIRDVPPATTVLDWLRTDKRLTGTKEGCAEGDCGACTVVLGIPDGDGLRHEAVNSCLMAVAQLAGRALLTVEGLAASGRLHPLQRAMVEADASQCGFCTPGIAMALYAFLEGGEEPEVETIHDALAGNLCRCTGYRPIVDAARKAERSPADAPSAASVPEAGPDYEAGAQVLLRAPDAGRAGRAASGEHPDAPILAGGTDLGLLFSKERRAFDAIISVARVEELCRLELRDDEIEIGAAVTYTRALPGTRCRIPGDGRADPAHRLAPDPQSRHHRRQYRQCVAHRRHAALPDRARRDAGAARGRTARARCPSGISSSTTAAPTCGRAR